jgi:hypothetical protein
VWCVLSLALLGWGVEAVHEFVVGGWGCVEFLVAFFELETQIDGLLFEHDNLLFESVDVVGGTEPGLGCCQVVGWGGMGSR